MMLEIEKATHHCFELTDRCLSHCNRCTLRAPIPMAGRGVMVSSKNVHRNLQSSEIGDSKMKICSSGELHNLALQPHNLALPAAWRHATMAPRDFLWHDDVIDFIQQPADSGCCTNCILMQCVHNFICWSLFITIELIQVDCLRIKIHSTCLSVNNLSTLIG